MSEGKGDGSRWREVTDLSEIDGHEYEEGVSVLVLRPSLPRWELGRILSTFFLHST